MRITSDQLDERDQSILTSRVDALNLCDGFRVGDFVIFADGVERRISYIWDFGDGDPDYPHVQTSDGGSYYLGDGYLSMSGGLHLGVHGSTLTLTDEVRDGSAWFFHHNHHTAHNGVDVRVSFRVFTCSQNATI